MNVSEFPRMGEGFKRTAQLGGYIEYAPPPVSRDFVDAMWLHRSEASSGVREHLVIPDPRISLAFFRGRSNSDEFADGKLAIIGPVTKPRPLPLRADREIIAIRIQPEFAFDVFGAPPSQYLDSIEGVGDLADYRDLANRLAAKADSRSSLEILLTWVMARMRKARDRQNSNCDRRLKQAVGLIGRRGRIYPIAQIAAICGLSVRHMRRLFHSQLGVGPKQLARLHRMERAILIADKFDRPRWADIAIAAGFADQAHMVRDCGNLIGHTPKSLFLNRRREAATHGLAISGDLAVAALAGAAIL